MSSSSHCCIKEDMSRRKKRWEDRPRNRKSPGHFIEESPNNDYDSDILGLSIYDHTLFGTDYYQPKNNKTRRNSRGHRTSDEDSPVSHWRNNNIDQKSPPSLRDDSEIELENWDTSDRDDNDDLSFYEYDDDFYEPNCQRCISMMSFIPCCPASGDISAIRKLDLVLGVISSLFIGALVTFLFIIVVAESPWKFDEVQPLVLVIAIPGISQYQLDQQWLSYLMQNLIKCRSQGAIASIEPIFPSLPLPNLYSAGSLSLSSSISFLSILISCAFILVKQN